MDGPLSWFSSFLEVPRGGVHRDRAEAAVPAAGRLQRGVDIVTSDIVTNQL